MSRKPKIISQEEYLYLESYLCHYRSESYSPCSSTTVDESLSSLMDQDLILEWWEEIWQRKAYENSFLSEFDPLPHSYEDTTFIGRLSF